MYKTPNLFQPCLDAKESMTSAIMTCVGIVLKKYLYCVLSEKATYFFLHSVNIRCKSSAKIHLLALAVKEHCGISSVDVMRALRLVQELEISPMTPMTPCCKRVTDAYTAFVTDI